MTGIVSYFSQVVRGAGQILRDDFSAQTKVHNKGDHDIVTATDLASEAFIIKAIQARYPLHHIVSEEAGKITSAGAKESENTGENNLSSALKEDFLTSKKSGPDYIWYIDPIDGTSNFVTGCPYFGVSIALAYRDRVIFGMVYQPITDELYIATINEGATCNGSPIRVSSRSRIADAYIATAYSADERDIKRGTKMARNIALHTRRTVLNFCPAIDLCNMARGKLDALLDNGSTVEDHAAGSIILSEAGGHLQNLSSNTWDFKTTGILATNGYLSLDELQEIITI
jgi:myo-inositol-1(or 4)-monophosphatase